jgi:transposase-like protein
MKAMKSSGSHPITSTTEVDEIVFGGQEEGVRGRKNKAKKLVVVGIEKKKKGVSRLYTREISHADAESLGGFMKDHISTEAHVTTDQWAGYGPLEEDFPNLVRIPSGKKGSNFLELHRVIMNLKSWIRGITKSGRAFDFVPDNSGQG